VEKVVEIRGGGEVREFKQPQGPCGQKWQCGACHGIAGGALNVVRAGGSSRENRKQNVEFEEGGSFQPGAGT
jgi:hypothetical protein